MKTRLWCFTNYDLSFNYQALFDKGTIKYMAYGEEICPTTQRKHHQGFVYFNNPRGSSKQVAIDFNKSHVEPCVGSLNDNEKYCSKESSLITFGTKPSQGERTDLEDVKNDIMAGKSVDAVCIDTPHLFHQYGRTLSRIEDICLRKKFRNWVTTCDWFYGKTGMGKSHHAFKDFDPATHYRVPDDNGWWDGYTGQSIVILDEFRGSKMKYCELLTLIDRYPITVRRRGREPAPFLATHIIITSCYSPQVCYKNMLDYQDSINQLLRRIKVFETFGTEVLEQKWSEVILDSDHDKPEIIHDE